MDNTSIYLSGHGIRPSVQRIAIMRYLQKNRTHPTADDVFESLKRQMPTLSKTTVYNTLKLFVEYGAAISIRIDEKNARYDSEIIPHAHFRCKSCGCIIDIPLNTEKILPQEFNGEVEETYFYLKGICLNCKKKKEQAAVNKKETAKSKILQN